MYSFILYTVPFEDNRSWLLVADRRRQNVYQVDVNSGGEIRAIFDRPGTQPTAVAVRSGQCVPYNSSLDARIFVAYENVDNRWQFGIKVISLNGTVLDDISLTR